MALKSRKQKERWKKIIAIPSIARYIAIYILQIMC